MANLLYTLRLCATTHPLRARCTRLSRAAVMPPTQQQPERQSSDDHNPASCCGETPPTTLNQHVHVITKTYFVLRAHLAPNLLVDLIRLDVGLLLMFALTCFGPLALRPRALALCMSCAYLRHQASQKTTTSVSNVITLPRTRYRLSMSLGRHRIYCSVSQGSPFEFPSSLR
jgi:hypothetical protein